MSLRFFSDHCIPTQIIQTLRQHGHEVIVLRNELPIRSPDANVIATAQRQQCVLVSLNGDFADIVTYPPRSYLGIIAIQLHNHPEVIPQLMTRLLRFLTDNPQMEYYVGKLLIVESHRIRIRS